MSITRDSFVFYRSFFEAIKGLPKEDQCLMFGAIADYSLDQIEPNLTGINKVIWTLIKPQLDANTKRFINGEKGGKHGSKGGRPKKITPESEDKNPIGDIVENPIGVINENPKETPNVNVNVNLNANDNLNVNEKENELGNPVTPGTILPEAITKIPKQQKEKIDFDALLNFFNHTFQKKCTVFDKTIQDKYNALIKKGYTKEDIASAMLNASKDHFHVENGYKHMTLEFFSRSVKIDKFANISNVKPKEPKKELPENVGGGSMLKAL